jgi:hypothetical protein
MQQVGQKSFTEIEKSGSFHGKGFLSVALFTDRLVALDAIGGVGIKSYPLYVYHVVKPYNDTVLSRFFKKAKKAKPIYAQECVDVFTNEQQARRAFTNLVENRKREGYVLAN